MPTHDRTLSNESALTSLPSDEDAALGADTSFSSDWSQISTRSREFMNNVKGIINSQIPLRDLVDRAEKLIHRLASNDEYNRLPYGSPKTKINLARVLEAMLCYAHDCGGEGGRRYTASAIYACRSDEKEATLAGLQSLGTTWCSHLLFVFKANNSHKTQMNPTPSEYATPTLDHTAAQMFAGASENREADFKAALLQRDGYRCVVTGLRDLHDPTADPQSHEGAFRTQACHILRRAVTEFDVKDRTSKTSQSAWSTLDILSHYASLPQEAIEEIISLIDHPSNGMTLQHDVHEGFDLFAWSLVEVPNTPNTYEIKYHSKRHGFSGDRRGSRVTFEDHSALYLEPSSPPRKKQRNTRSGNVGDKVQEVQQGIALPNPLYFRIHSALAGVLHMSGAAEEIDAIIERSSRGGAAGAVLVGDEFEELCKLESLRESVVTSMMKQMTVK